VIKAAGYIPNFVFNKAFRNLLMPLSKQIYNFLRGFLLFLRCCHIPNFEIGGQDFKLITTE
jgi:hypothetical protein